MASTTEICTPSKVVIDHIWSADKCLLCDINFKESGKTTKYVIQHGNGARNDKDWINVIKNIFGIDLTDINLVMARMCSICKSSLERILKINTLRENMKTVLLKNYKSMSSCGRQKRGAKSSPSPKKVFNPVKRVCSKSATELFGDDLNVGEDKENITFLFRPILPKPNLPQVELKCLCKTRIPSNYVQVRICIWFHSLLTLVKNLLSVLLSILMLVRFQILLIFYENNKMMAQIQQISRLDICKN